MKLSGLNAAETGLLISLLITPSITIKIFSKHIPSYYCLEGDTKLSCKNNHPN